MIVLYFLFFSITLLYGIILPFFEEKSDFPFFYLKIPNNYIFSSIFLHIWIIFMLYLAIRFVLPYIIFVVLAGIKSVVLYIKNGN